MQRLIALFFLFLQISTAIAGLTHPYKFLSAPWTPLDPVTQDIAFDVIPKQVEYEAKSGVNVVWAVGGMGKWSTMTMAERKALAEIWITEGHKYGMEIIVHVGSNCIRDSIELAKHAEEKGADAIAILPPFSPISIPDLPTLVEVCAQVANSVKIPFYYYHMPGTTGIKYRMKDFITAALPKIPTLKGIKYVDDDLNDFAACKNMSNPNYGNFVMLWANNPKIQSLPYGATAFTLAESYTGPYLKDIVDKYYAGDMVGAQKAQDRLTTLYSITSGCGKDILTMIGIPMGGARLPELPPTASRYQTCYNGLKAFGFVNLFEYGHATIRGTSLDPQVKAEISFSTTTGGIQVQVLAEGLEDHAGQTVGIHVHEFGDLTSQDGSAAGSHYVGRGSTNHSCPEVTSDRHEGDMGNFQVDANGKINQTKVLDLLSLSGSFSIIGRAVVIHNHTDDCVTASSASFRIGQGVIGVGNPNIFINNDVLTNNLASVSDNVTSIASCVLQPTAGNTIQGTVYFKQLDNGKMAVTAKVTGLLKGTSHGILIHEFGELSVSDGTGIGGHYNPFGVKHALPLNPTRHIGDLGNIFWDNGDQTFWYYFENDLLNFSSLNGILGRSVAIHAKIDDGCTQPTGNTGDILATCVIGISPNAQIPTLPNGCCGDQQKAGCEPDNALSSEKPFKTSPWVVFGIVVGLIFLIIAIGVSIWYYKKSKARYESI